MELRDLALSVREMPDHSYGWVILEGTGERSVFATYALLESSERTYASYADALVAGLSALRALGGRDGPRGVGAARR
jgi:hypothetical protein